MNRFFVLALIVAVPLVASAEDNLWVHSSSGKWSVARNWSLGVPTSTQRAVFGSDPLLPAGAVLNVDGSYSAGSLANYRNLKITYGGLGLYDTEAASFVTGNVTLVGGGIGTVKPLTISGYLNCLESCSITGPVEVKGNISIPNTMWLTDGAALTGHGTTLLGPTAKVRMRSGGGGGEPKPVAFVNAPEGKVAVTNGTDVLVDGGLFVNQGTMLVKNSIFDLRALKTTNTGTISISGSNVSCYQIDNASGSILLSNGSTLSTWAYPVGNLGRLVASGPTTSLKLIGTNKASTLDSVRLKYGAYLASDGTLDNVNHTLDLRTIGGRLVLSNPMYLFDPDIDGGTILGSSRIRFDGVGGNFRDCTFDEGFRVEDGRQVDLKGNVASYGPIVVPPTVGWYETILSTSAGSTLDCNIDLQGGIFQYSGDMKDPNVTATIGKGGILHGYGRIRTRYIDGDLTNLGLIQADVPGQSLNGGWGMTVRNKGRIIVRKDCDFDWWVHNVGTVRFDEGPSAYCVLTQDAGSTTVNRVVEGDATINGGFLTGKGKVAGLLTNASIVKLTDGVSDLTASRYTQSASGRLVLSILDSTATKGNCLRIDEDAFLEGTLEIHVPKGFVPPDNALYKVVQFGSKAPTGMFAQLLVRNATQPWRMVLADNCLYVGPGR